MKNSILLKTLALMACLLCSISAMAQDAYACYTSSDSTLTFYYDDLRYSRNGITYNLLTWNDGPGWRNDGTNTNVTKVVFDPSFVDARPTSTYKWFYNMENLKSISGMDYFNTSEVTDMACMFEWCVCLTSLDLSSFNTDKVTDMGLMFEGCHNLTSIDVSSFNTANVTSMSSMFAKCYALTSVDVSNFNTEKVTYMGGMFDECYALTSVDVSSFNTANVTDISWMFAYTGLTSLDLSNFNTEKVKYMDNLCYNSPDLAYVDVSSFNTANVVRMSWLFSSCSSLTTLSLNNFNTENVTDMGYMFQSCSSLTSLDLSSFNTEKVTDMSRMFGNCNNLVTIEVGSEWSTAAVNKSENMFIYCFSLVGGMGTTYSSDHIDAEYARIDGGPSNPGYFTDKNASQTGDVNGDGQVTISDVTALIDLLLGGGSINNPAADCNNDTNVTISDVTKLIDYLLSGSWN